MSRSLRTVCFISFLISCLTCSCSDESSGFQVEIDLRNANPGDIFLYRLSFDRPAVKVDSIHSSRLDERFTLSDPDREEEATIYQVTLTASRSVLYVISDSRKVSVKINAVDPYAYSVSGSPGSVALQKLQQIQKPLFDSLSILNNKLRNPASANVEELRKQAIRLGDTAQRNYFLFADSTTTPLAALLAAQQIDFGTDRARQKQFIEGLGKRFPGHPDVQGFVTKTRNYLSLFEVEYQVGDTLPEGTFFDWYGKPVNSGSWKGAYCLLEFWASYCPPCLQRLNSYKEIYRKFYPKGFQLIAFSLDEDREMLESTLKFHTFLWPVVSDLKGWAGHGVNTYKIDSIPFNILVGPDGRVKGKNVGPDSLEIILEQWHNR